MSNIPTLYEWAGGMASFEKLTTVFYGKVLKNPILGPVFKHMSPDHQQHVAHFMAEVFGGPQTYSETGGSQAGMVQKHLGKHLTEQQRKENGCAFWWKPPTKLPYQTTRSFVPPLLHISNGVRVSPC